MSRHKTIFITFMVAMLVSAGAINFLRQPAEAAQKNRAGDVSFFGVLDSGKHPCVHTRLYVIVSNPLKPGEAIARPLLVSQVEENQVVTGWAFPVRGDLIPASWLDGSVPDEAAGALVPYDVAAGPLYVERLRGIGHNNQIIGTWRSPLASQCYSGDPTE